MDTHATPLYNLWQTRRRLRLRLVTVLAVAVCLIAWHIPTISVKTTPVRSESQPTKTSPETLEKGTPSYTTLVPSGKNIDALGGWTRVSPPDHNAVYAYADNIAGVPVTVSEQPIPDTFKDSIDSSVETLAKSYSANRSISAGNVTVYIGTSAKGPQSIIFVKNNTLILIKSTSALNDGQWSGYIESLQ